MNHLTIFRPFDDFLRKGILTIPSIAYLQNSLQLVNEWAQFLHQLTFHPTQPKQINNILQKLSPCLKTYRFNS